MANAEPVPGPLFRISEVETRYGLKRDTLRRLAKARIIPHYRVGGLIMFAADDLDAYLTATRVEAR